MNITQFEILFQKKNEDIKVNVSSKYFGVLV